MHYNSSSPFSLKCCVISSYPNPKANVEIHPFYSFNLFLWPFHLLPLSSSFLLISLSHFCSCSTISFFIFWTLIFIYSYILCFCTSWKFVCSVLRIGIVLKSWIGLHWNPTIRPIKNINLNGFQGHKGMTCMRLC